MYMNSQHATKHKRINITLPVTTLKRIDHLAEDRNRSRLIDQALQYYIDSISRKNLRALLKEGAVERTKRDADVSAEWFHLENEV